MADTVDDTRLDRRTIHPVYGLYSTTTPYPDLKPLLYITDLNYQQIRCSPATATSQQLSVLLVWGPNLSPADMWGQPRLAFVFQVHGILEVTI